MRAPRLVVAVVVVVTVLAACRGGGDDLDPVGLEGIGDDRPAEVDDPDDGADATPGDGADEGSAVEPQPLRGLVDGRLVPGPFEVGPAGVVTFDVVDGQLRIVAVDPADGWRERSRDVDGDDLEVVLVRAAGGEATVEVELDDDELTLELDVEVEPVDPGTFPIGDAASVTVAVRDGALVVEDLTVADGWQLSKDAIGDGKVEVELERGGERWKAKLELDGGTLSHSAEYSSGDVPRGRR